MDRLYAAREGLNDLATPGTIVCRCEEVTAAEIDEALANGITELAPLKASTRVTMGPCQGRMCLPALSTRVARAAKSHPGTVELPRPRPPARPLPLSWMSETGEPGTELTKDPLTPLPNRQRSTVAPIIGIYHPSPDKLLAPIREAEPSADIRLCTERDALDGILEDVEILLAFKFGFYPFPREQILRAPKLRWVQLSSAGVDHMLPFDADRIVVTNGSGVHGDIISQFVFGALAQLMWDFPRLARQQAEHRWERYAVASLVGRTMGIVGIGSIGVSLVRHARAYGMRVIGTRRSGEPVDGVDRTYAPDAVGTVLEQSDVVVVAAPLTRDTRDLLGAAELRHMRPSAYLVSISRGGIVNEEALLEALGEGRMAGAVLDVFTEEPLPSTSPFWDIENVIVTPHISGELMDWPEAVAGLFVDNLKRYLASEPLRNVVDPGLGY
jgi:phosphoglycerate dehydrogenase-like enzyme/bacterioferritin-associated ferredoxin